MATNLERRLLALSAETLHTLVGRIAELSEFNGWWAAQGSLSPLRLRAMEAVTIVNATQVEAAADPAQRMKHGPPGVAVHFARAQAAAADSTRSGCYGRVLRSVFAHYEQMPLGLDLIRRLHSELLRYPVTGEEIRPASQAPLHRVGLTRAQAKMEAVSLRPPPPSRAAVEMSALIEWTNEALGTRRFHPLVVIPSFLLEFLSIRPFERGNARISRILEHLLLLQAGYTYVRYASLDKEIANRGVEYYLALRHSQANRNQPTPDISAWLLAFLDVLCSHAGTLRAMARQYPDESRLSRNQLEVLRLVDKYGDVTNRLVCAELGIPRETAKQVLNRLLRLNLVRRTGCGRAVRYQRRLPPD